jgi:hypothetical protein
MVIPPGKKDTEGAGRFLERGAGWESERRHLTLAVPHPLAPAGLQSRQPGRRNEDDGLSVLDGRIVGLVTPYTIRLPELTVTVIESFALKARPSRKVAASVCWKKFAG